MITAEQIKELRDATGVSVMQCKKALEETGGDMEKAVLVLKKKSADIAAKKSDRMLGAGTIAAYIHGEGSVGAMVFLSCETDFVAKNEEFKKLAYEIAMQVAAPSPEFHNGDSIPGDTLRSVRELFARETEDLNKDDVMKEKIIGGKVAAYFKDKIL